MTESSLIELQNLIAGEFLAPNGTGRFDVINPATLEKLAEMPASSPEDVDKAVRSARDGFEGWSKTTPAERAAALTGLAAAVEENNEEFARLEAQNVGKPYANALEDEVPIIVDSLRFFAGAGRMLPGQAAGEYVADHTSIIRREPIGVVAAITPWNYPLWQAVWKIAPAIATGNTVVIKPAELTPLTTVRFVELAQKFLPPGVLNLVLGDGPETGAALVQHPGVDMVSVTGSERTGRAIATLAADSVKRVVLELGGNAPVVIFDDADRDAVLETFPLAGYYNAGQECTAGSRILAGPKIYDELVDGLAQKAREYKVGDTFAEGTQLGPLISEQQRDRFFELLSQRSADSEIVAGGGRPDLPGFYAEPTVVAGLDQNDPLVQSEVFGPAITVQRFDDEDQAIAWANDTKYGLAASVWTQNASRALRIGKALQFGTVWVNTHLVITPEMPHGGFKQSGYGKEGGIYALEEYTNAKHLVVNIA
jgi:betaine-aldehyde dehydrogenase